MTEIRKLTAPIDFAHDDETKNRVRVSLLTKSDSYLKELGVSRSLLEQGIDAWPWRLDSDRNNSHVA